MKELSALLTLGQAADHLQWSVKTLKRRLLVHRIATIGTGRAARLEKSDLELLKAKEREVSRRQHPPIETPPPQAMPAGMLGRGNTGVGA